MYKFTMSGQQMSEGPYSGHVNYSPNMFITGAEPQITALLKDYYQAVTHLCSTGLQLAGRLERDLSMRDQVIASHKNSSQEPTMHKILRISTLYSDIISNMGPLWQHTKTDNTGSVIDQTEFLRHQAEQLEKISSCFVEFHMSVLESGQSLCKANDHPPTQKSGLKDRQNMKPVLRRKDSPCIVITDTSRTSPNRGQDTTVSHVPTDSDMMSIINFLSTTQTTSGVGGDHHTAPPPYNLSLPDMLVKKQPLSNQRSSPLPTSPGAEQKSYPQGLPPEDQTAFFVRHHSDWQLYANSKRAEEMGLYGQRIENLKPSYHGAHSKPYHVTNNHRNHFSQTSSGKTSLESAYQQSPSMALPFSSWSLGGKKDNVWSQESAPSSGDESLSNNEQIYRQNQTRRSSYDSSQVFDTARLVSNAASTLSTQISPPSTEHPPVQHPLVKHPPVDHTWSLPTTLASYWSSGDTSKLGHEAKVLHQPGVITTHADSIWKPLDINSGIACAQLKTLEHDNNLFSSQSKATQSKNML